MPALDSRPTLEAPDDDPYLWLEEIESARVLNWVEEQNAATLQRFNDAGVATDHKVLKTILDRPDNIPFPNRRAGRLFNPWRDAANPRGVWRTRAQGIYRENRPRSERKAGGLTGLNNQPIVLAFGNSSPNSFAVAKDSPLRFGELSKTP